MPNEENVVFKTLLLADPDGRERCVGKEVDDFIEIEAIPEVLSLDDWANRTCQHIRKLAQEGVPEGGKKNGVRVEIAGNGVWNALMSHIVLTMEKEGITVVTEVV